MEMKGVLGTCNLRVQRRDYAGGDVNKSLDTIVNERGYVKPPSYKTGGDNSLPITGKRAVFTSKLDPMTHSLEEMIVKPPSSKSRGGGGGRLPIKGSAVVASALDPMENSLDDIIQSGKAARQENGGGQGGGGPYDRKKRFREELERKASRDEEEDGDDSTAGKDRGKRRRFTNKLTPYRAVTFLSEKLMIIEVKCGLKVEFTEENTPQKWRCVVTCGSLEGIADSSRKVVARELACQEFLKLLKEAFPDGKIPEYELPPEIFLDPKVYRAIEKEGEEAGTNVTFDMCMENKFGGLEGGRLPFFKCVYYMNGSEFFGRSTDKNFAQLKAAGKVYETMTGEKFPETKYFTGLDCDPNVEYDFSESEVHSFAVGSAGMLTDEKME